MHKKRLSIIALLLALTTSLGTFAACEPKSDEATDAQSTEKIEQTTFDSEDHTTDTENESIDINSPLLEGKHAALVENAYNLSDGIQTAYNADRSAYTITNLIGSLDYRLTGSESPMVASLKNTEGAAYLTDTMDVFVSTESGKTYYASTSGEQARVNLYRLGFYYYDVHFLEQDFVNSISVEKTADIPIESFKEYKDTTKPSIKDGVLSAKITNQSDPQVFANMDYSAEEYNTLQFSFKSDAVGSIRIYVVAGDSTHHNDNQSFTVDMTGAGDWTTYSVPLNSSTIPGYTGQIKSIRFDFGGAVNTSVYLKDVKLQKVVKDSIPLSMDRIIHSFPDKLHQEIHIVAYENTSGISEIGIETKIDPEKVSKLLVKDKSGDKIFDVSGNDTKDLSRFLKDIDWESAEYVAFDIKDAGIFGYILPYDNESGKIEISIKHGDLVLTQTDTPEGGRIIAPTNSTANDFRMGHRLYTDGTHDFAAFLNEAYCERNPLDENNIKIDSEKFVRGAKFKGYDPLRGVYHITIKGAGSFNDPYYKNQNLYYNASFSIKGDDRDRKLYVMTFTASGVLECAALLDENNLMLPVPLQVSKNFSEKEEPFYNCGDATYGETFFPITLNAGDEQYYTVLNMYQNWGNFPLKQLSSIGYYMPYYHLSTGVTETNCISPWYNRGKNLWTLPDHRSMSMPASSDLKNMYSYGNQPQRPNAGFHYFLQYTDADGNYYSSEYIDNDILSYGPTYADVRMNYLSDDGKIKVTLRHMEMPQNDENRGYYEMTYEIMDTVVIDNFREDFSFYTMAGMQTYRKVGYLNKNNTPAIKDVNEREGKPFPIPLGDECPYFSLFYIPESKEYSNLSFLIYDSEIIIGGQKSDAGFAVMDENYSLRLTLNLDKKVTLQAGDKITIYAIIMPWGGGYVTDDDVLYHPMDDLNVQNVRLNTLLNPFKATALENCEVTDSVFLPRVRSTNGKNATFKVSGGYDIDPEKADTVNVTVRVDGFDSIAKLKVEELVDGSWVIYDISSQNTPDSSNNSASFDGYAIHYDGEGKFGYSFVIAVTDGRERTFRVSAEK